MQCWARGEQNTPKSWMHGRSGENDTAGVRTTQGSARRARTRVDKDGQEDHQMSATT